MATNLIKDNGWQLAVVADDPAAPNSGDPVRFGTQVGVALNDEGDGGAGSTETITDFGPRVWDLSVDDDLGSAIAAGDRLYYHDTQTGSPATSVNNNPEGADAEAGIALEAVSANATTTIEVLLARGVGGRKPSKGFVPLDITTMREIASDDIQALVAHGGLLSSDSDPALARVNGATDKALRVTWDGTNDTDEAQFAPVAMPHDLDAAQDLTIHFLMAMGGATDTPTVDVQVFDGLGDTEMGGATAAVTGTTITEYSVTVANANVGGPPTGFLNIALVPGVHTTDDLHLYAAWVEYRRAES